MSYDHQVHHLHPSSRDQRTSTEIRIPITHARNSSRHEHSSSARPYPPAFDRPYAPSSRAFADAYPLRSLPAVRPFSHLEISSDAATVGSDTVQWGGPDTPDDSRPNTGRRRDGDEGFFWQSADSLTPLPQMPPSDAGETMPRVVPRRMNTGKRLSARLSGGVVGKALGLPSPEPMVQVKGDVITDWDGPDDAANPKLWSLRSRIFHTMLPALYGFSVSAGTSIYSPGVFDVMAKFNVSQEVALLGLSMYALGLGFGPVIGAPISETRGRKAVYLYTLPIFLLFIMGAGLAQNIQTFIVCRFLASTFGAPALAVGAGTIADLWDMEKGGGLATVLLTSTFFFGPSLGPLIGGYTMQTRGDWRWLMWATMLTAGPIWFLALPSKETSKKIILAKRAKQRGLPGPPKPPPAVALKMLMMVTLVRPVKMLVTEPIVASWALYHAFVFGVLFAFFDSYPYVFLRVYKFTFGQVGLAFLGIFVGVIFAVITFGIIDKTIYQKKKALALKNGFTKPPPEDRLYVSMLGSIGVPIALFWFAWTAREDVHWMVPIAAGVPFGWGTVTLFLGGMTFLLDTYGAMYGASAVAANGLLRYTFGAAFPMFTIQMYNKLGVDWATSLLAFIGLGLLPLPFVLYRYGPALRSRSSFQ